MNFSSKIDQPALVINESIARRNIKRMVEKVKAENVRFRPHFKTHQSAKIGDWFRAEGVEKITVSSVEMAEYFADHGWEDILIAFSLNIRQINRIAGLAKRVHLGVLVENLDAVHSLADLTDVTLDVWIKVDAGNHRTGIDWQDYHAVETLITEVNRFPNLHLIGLLTHSGNTYHCVDSSAVVMAFREGVDHMNELKKKLELIGIRGLEISVGDTPGCSLCSDFSGIDELRPGNFVFYDAQQMQAGSCAFEDIAVAVACPVVALHPERSEIVIYGGAIHLSKDLVMLGNEPSFGLVALAREDGWGRPIRGAIVRSLSQEHGVLHFNEGEFPKVNVGDLIYVLPAHSCLTVTLMKQYLTLSGDIIKTMNSDCLENFRGGSEDC